MVRQFFVYILASRKRTLYVGVTSDLRRRLSEHRAAHGSAFTRRYKIARLVYVETYRFVGDARRREKQMKDWSRARKVALIEAANPAWDDLADGPLL